MHEQGAKKNIFTSSHSGKLKLAFTSADFISTSPKSFLMSKIILLLFELLKKHYLPIVQVKNRIHLPNSKIHLPQAIRHYFLCTLRKNPLKKPISFANWQVQQRTGMTGMNKVTKTTGMTEVTKISGMTRMTVMTRMTGITRMTQGDWDDYRTMTVMTSMTGMSRMTGITGMTKMARMTRMNAMTGMTEMAWLNLIFATIRSKLI